MSRSGGKKSCGYWVERLRLDYLSRGGSVETWSGDYWKILRRLPPDEPLTASLLADAVQQTTPNSKTRKRACFATGALARFANVRYDPSPYAGKYGPDSVVPRTIPTDKEIFDYWESIQNPGWKWVYSSIAAYGLRPHEAFLVDLDQLKLRRPDLRVLEGKTGARTTYPYPAAWFQSMRIWLPRLPNVKIVDRSHQAIGHSATAYFHGRGCPHSLYDLRHAYALRMVGAGVRDTFAAKYMGHSEAVHQRIYRRWVDERDLSLEWERTTGHSVAPDTTRHGKTNRSQP